MPRSSLPPRSRRAAITITTAIAGCLTLAACGGGGGGGGGSSAPTSYTVTPTASANGSISPATPQTVSAGATTSFTLSAASGFRVAGATGCSGTLSGTTYTTAAISAACTVTASFEPVPPPAAPTLSLTPRAIKTFAFSWTAIAGATEYRLLENADGSSGFSPVATAAGTATTIEREVFLPARVNARYILQACNAGGCTDSSPVFVSGTLAAAVGYVKASNTGAEDRFGSSIALSGDGSTLAVGAQLEGSAATGVGGNQNDDSAPLSGAVYVFVRSAGSWSQQAYIKASNAEEDDRFGFRVALSGDGSTLVVGAATEDSSARGVGGDQADNSAAGSGAVYVFTRSGAAWSQQAYIKASNTEASDYFGWVVALSGDGNTLAVAAVGEGSNARGVDGNQASNVATQSGAVYVFARSGTSWSQQAYLKASNTGQDDQLGWEVALSGDGNTLAVGARYEDGSATGVGGDQADDSALRSGAVYVFTRSGAAWSQQAYVKASNTDAGDNFGMGVALSGDGSTLAVGAPNEGSNARGVGGDQADNGALRSGAVYVFTRSGTAWSQQAYIKASNTDAGDQFGGGVALSGDGGTLAVGARNESSSASGIGGDQADNDAFRSGAVYVFTRSGAAWSQQAYVKASNTGRLDWFGGNNNIGLVGSLALAGDGSIMAVGAERESSRATGIGGDQADDSALRSGAVYLY